MKSIIGHMRILALLLCLAGIATSAFGQTASGRLSGVVQDPAKAAVSGATISVMNERTGEERKADTGSDGLYVIAPLQPSVYTVTVTKEGFASAKATGVQVTVGLEMRRDFTLQLAALSTSVTVVSVSEVPIDTTSASIGVNLTEREVSTLPINGRQLSQLVLQAPGATNAGAGNFQDIRFSGQATEQNAVRYDGIDGSAVVDAEPGNLSGETASPFHLQSSLENVQEFRVDSNDYPAEYGTGDGGQVSIITKSGSNAFHGSVYEYLRNDKLDAKNYFDLSQSKSKLRLNQFGASLGGPIAKDKLFFFVYYEGYRLHAAQNWIESAPSSKFSALPDCASGQSFPTVQCVNHDVKQLLPGFHSPSAILIQPDTTSSLGNSSLDVYQLSGLNLVNEDSGGGRFDYRVNNNNSFYVRFFRDQGYNAYPEGITGRSVHIVSFPQNGVAALTSTVSNSLVNEVKFGYNQALTRIYGTAPIVNGIDFSTIAINPTGSITLSGIAGQGGSAAGLAIPGGLVRANSATNGVGSPYTPYSLSFIDNVSWVQGIHSMKFGTEVRLVRMHTDRLGGTTYSFSNLTNLINGALSSADDLVDVNNTTGATLAMMPAFDDAQIPFISLAGAIQIVQPVRKWTFKTPHTDRMACEKIFADLKRRNLTTIALISGTDAFGKSMRDQCVAVAPGAGIKIAHEESYGPRDSDMTPQLTNIRNAAGVQAVVNPGFGQGPAIVTRNYRQLGITLPLYQSHGVASKQFIDLAGPAAEGVRLPAAGLLVADKLADNDPQKPVVVDYTRTYQQKTGQPVSTFGGHAYDGLMILVQAMARAKSADAAKVRDEIEKTKGYVGTGGIVNMSPTDHLGLDLTAFRMLEIKNGDWTLVPESGS